MAFYYADSSVLVKRHLLEQGSSWVRGLTLPQAGHSIITARLSQIEVVSALNRRVREGTLSLTDYQIARNDFLARYRRSYRVVPITHSLLARTRLLLEQHPLRSYDALHLASALLANDQLTQHVLPPLTFLAADTRLLAAAQAEGLVIDDPNAHP